MTSRITIFYTKRKKEKYSMSRVSAIRIPMFFGAAISLIMLLTCVAFVANNFINVLPANNFINF